MDDGGSLLGAKNAPEAIQIPRDNPHMVRFRVRRSAPILARAISMLFFLLPHVFSLLLDLMWLSRRAEQDTDLELLLLRQQLRILQRKQLQSPRISRWE